MVANINSLLPGAADQDGFMVVINIEPPQLDYLTIGTHGYGSASARWLGISGVIHSDSIR